MIPAQDINAYINGAVGRLPEVITAGAGNDGVEVDGPTFDRQTLPQLFHSLSCMIMWSTTLAATETLTLLANIQDSANGSDWADLGSATSKADGTSEILASSVVATGPGGGGTVTGVTKFGVEIQKARRYLRLQSTATLSAGATDTAAIAAILVLGGADVLPA